MAKLVQFWYDRSKLMRAGIAWALAFQLIRVIFWYVTQNLSFTSMSSATTVNYVYTTFNYLELTAAVVAIAGIVGELGGKRKRRDDGIMKLADGRYMIKK